MLPYPVFDIVPDFTDPPTYGVTNVVERASLSPAIDAAFFPQHTPDQSFAFNFAFTAAADSRAMKDFFRDRGGRMAPFYLPSWRADLPAITGVAGSNSSGDTKITVEAEDYNATHLDGTAGDHYGRQIFIWQPDEDLFTASVVAATQDTSEHAVLTLSKFLPFTVDIKTAIIGFLHLAHFDADDLSFDHLTSAAATMDAKFRAARESSDETPTLAVTRVDLDGPDGADTIKGFATATVAAGVSDPPDTRVAWGNGPAVLHTIASPLFGTGWTAWANGDGIRIKTAAAPPPFSQSVPDGTGTLSGLVAGFIDTEHISLSFTRNAWEAIAYQRTATAIRIWLKQFAGPVAYNFDGLDPVLANSGEFGLSDPENAVVICYYRKPSDSRLYARFSTDLYAIEYTAAALPLRPIKLIRAYKSGLTVKLEYLDAHFRTVTLTSAAYPAP